MIFVCVDSKSKDSGVKIYKVPFDENNEWHCVGKSRWAECLSKVQEYREQETFPVYDSVVEDDLPLGYQAYQYATENDLIADEEVKF